MSRQTNLRLYGPPISIFKKGDKPEDKPEVKDKTDDKGASPQEDESQKLLQHVMQWLVRQFGTVYQGRNPAYARVTLKDTKPPSKAFTDVVAVANRIIQIHKDNGLYFKCRLNAPRGPIIGSALIAEEDLIDHRKKLVFLVENEQQVTSASILEPRVNRKAMLEQQGGAEIIQQGGGKAEAPAEENWDDLV